jgi:hypothetical protein
LLLRDIFLLFSGQLLILRVLLQLLAGGQARTRALLLGLLADARARVHLVLRVDVGLLLLRPTTIMVLSVIAVKLVLELVNEVLLVSRLHCPRILVQCNLVLLMHHPLHVLL